jgi:hypothetical protein
MCRQTHSGISATSRNPLYLAINFSPPPLPPMPVRSYRHFRPGRSSSLLAKPSPGGKSVVPNRGSGWGTGSRTMAVKKGGGGAAPRGGKAAAKASAAKTSGPKTTRTAAKIGAKPTVAKSGGVKFAARKRSAARPSAGKNARATAAPPKSKAAPVTAKKSDPKQTSSSISSIASDILSGKLKPTLEHIKALATSVLGQGPKKAQSKGNR